jgi:threonyl-tRNA synthetase
MKFDSKLNHSAAHILAYSVKKLYGNEVKLGIGPSTDEGFYYDFLFPEPINTNDLAKIEKQMQKIVSSALKFEKAELSKEEALSIFKNEQFKVELIGEIKDQITIYRTGSDFLDLCSGPHIENTKELKNFKLLSLAGSYWKGNSSNPQLTRIYGTAWNTKEELEEFLNILEERKERDHRKLGKDLDIFSFNMLAGQGMPFWMENGTAIKRVLSQFITKELVRKDYQIVNTPILGSVELYKISGHWDHYRQNMFPLMEVENEKLILRPMTCPHHCLVYKHKQRSYRDLPLKLFEESLLHRYEYSGALTGIERVRSMLLPDSHVFITPEQISESISEAYEIITKVIKKLSLKVDYISLSTRDANDKEKFFNDDKMWDKAEHDLKSICDALKIEYKEMPGEAAFYGPKIDFQVKTALGHEITVSTIQLDFLLPKKFEVEYKSSEGNMQTPILVHIGFMSTHERLIATILEQTKGVLPLWLAPKQVVIIPVNEKHVSFCKLLKERLLNKDIRTSLDTRDERLAKKIREAQISKIPFQLVIGDNEVSDMNLVSYREYGSDEIKKSSIEEFIDRITKESI